jgi:hypothetical protein
VTLTRQVFGVRVSNRVVRGTITLDASPTTNCNDFFLVDTWTVLAVSGTTATTSNESDNPCLGVGSSCTLTTTELGGANASNDAGLDADGGSDDGGACASSLSLQINAQFHSLVNGMCTVAGTSLLTPQ